MYFLKIDRLEWKENVLLNINILFLINKHFIGLKYQMNVLYSNMPTLGKPKIALPIKINFWLGLLKIIIVTRDVLSIIAYYSSDFKFQ